MIAVILAAGQGKRFNGLNKPKGFLNIYHKKLIQYSLENIRRIGIKKVIIATGYKSEYYDALCNNSIELYGLEIKTVFNEKYKVSGSMYSLYNLKELINEDFILLDSDIIYDFEGFKEYVEKSSGDSLFITNASESGDEVYVEIFEQAENFKKNQTL